MTEAITMIATITDVAMPAAVMNGMPATASPRIAMTTVPPAKITAGPAVATARPAASVTERPSREVLAVARHEEERVVDADAEADHRGDLGRPARDVDEMVDQRHRGDADAQPEHSDADREPHGDDRAEREQEDDQCSEQSEEFGRLAAGLLEVEEEVAAHLDAQRLTLQLADGVLEPVEVVAGQVLDHRILDRHHCDPAVGGDCPRGDRLLSSRGERAGRSDVASTLGSASTARCARASSSRAEGESKNVSASSVGVATS